MQVLSDGRVRRSRGEWQEIVKRFGKSGLTEAAFCRREKISRARFVEWRRRLCKPGAEPAIPFVEISSLEVPSAPAGEFELTLPGGVLLRWKA